MLQELTGADRKLINIFGDTIHQNDGSHLCGGVSVAVDTSWQRRYQDIVAGPFKLYELPRGRIAFCYLNLLMLEWESCQVDRKWNSERPLSFPACILYIQKGVSMGARGIKDVIEQ